MPLLGVSVAMLAIAERGRLGVGWRVLSLAGAAGALSHAVSGPLVVFSQNQNFSPLFKGAVLMALWFLAVAVAAPRLMRATAAGSVAPGAQMPAPSRP
jgi:hypothetical protein